MSENAVRAATALLQAEEYYIMYLNDPEGTTFISIDGIPTEYSYKTLFVSYIQIMGGYFKEDDEDCLTEEEQTAFMAVLREHYDYYVLIHNDLVNEKTESTESTEGQA